VDAVAAFVRTGLVAPSGYLRSAVECASAGVPDALIARIRERPDGEREVVLDPAVTVTAQDVRQLQLAKGSIAAGIALLLQRAGITPDDLDAVLVAGTFGTFLRKGSLLAIGMLPAVRAEGVRFVGNAAGAGARLMLVDEAARQRAVRLAPRCEFVELAGDTGYLDAFCAGVPFPAPA
jgi:uncharacterized 2Fe-2S/4Fe-4S cluster protein (DUF4445 family)